MAMKTSRIVLWGSIGALGVIVLGILFRPQPVLVDLATIEKGVLTISVHEEGKTKVREIYTLAAPIEGRLLRIENEVGDQVMGGKSEIAKIEPATPAFLDVRSESEAKSLVNAAKASLKLAQAEWERAQAELTFATGELGRTRTLFTKGTISQKRLDEDLRTHRVATAQLLTAQAALDIRNHELERAKAKLLSRSEMEQLGQVCECLILRAPIDGQVLRVLQESETVVARGTKLIEIGNPADLEIVVDLLSKDAVRVKPGQKAMITGWGGEGLTAVVQRVEPYGYTKVSALGIEEQRVNVVLQLTASKESWQQLGHGYRVNATITLMEKNALKVPLGALFRQGDQWMVFREMEGEAEAVPVTLGLKNSSHAEVLEGLSEADQVIMYPADRVRSGVLIEQR